MDIGMGAIEAPRQIAGGMRDAVQSVMDLESTYVDGAGFHCVCYQASWELLEAEIGQ